MTVKPTSLEAYDSIDLNERQAEVLRAIRELYAGGLHPSDQEIASHLGWPINRVTGRRGELVAAGIVQKSGLKPGPTGRMVMAWMPVPKQLLLQLGIAS